MSRPELLDPLEIEPGGLGGLHSPNEGMLLTTLAEGVPFGEAIVEIGSWTGVSALRLAAGAEISGAAYGHRPNVVCVDPWPDPHPDEPDQDFIAKLAQAPGLFRQRMDQYEWPVVALRGNSVDVARMWMQGIGLLWIDANHHREFVLADYEAWHRFVVPGGWLVMHDYLGDTLEPNTDVAAVIEEVIKPSGLWEDRGLVDKLWYGRRLP